MVEPVRFELTVDLDAVAGDPADELGRILRYWGGATTQLDLTSEAAMAVMDSAYTPVGEWRLVASPDRPQP